MGKRGKDDDAALWQRVAAAASPLKGRKAASLPSRQPAPKAKPAPLEPQKLPVPPKAPKPRPVASAAPLDRQTSRQLEKGRLELEATLDLHGLRQRDAHAQLRRFLKTAQARGLRHVLVITGKGADPEARKSFYAEEERGVLRQAVPGWLGAPEFSEIVVSYSPAPRRLGGEGALYVRVRRPRDSK